MSEPLTDDDWADIRALDARKARAHVRVLLREYDRLRARERRLAEAATGAIALLRDWDGRPATPVDVPVHGTGGGVPSCDSELAAIRDRVRRGNGTPEQAFSDRDALLRMVDELIKDRNEAVDKLLDVIDERDDLRAKLAEVTKDKVSAERCWAKEYLRREELEAKLSEQSDELERLRTLDANHAAIDAAWREHVAELQAKLSTVTSELCKEARAHGETQARLAEAESTIESWAENAGATRMALAREKDRAEAAEARAAHDQGRRRSLEGIVSAHLEEPGSEWLREAFRKWCEG